MESDLKIANRIMPINEAYVLACEATGGVGVPGSGKNWCPFGGINHDHARTVRLYENTNSAHCFSNCGYLSPVKLIEWSMDLTTEDAIEYIFQRQGFKHKTPHERWDDLMAEKPEVDRTALAEALKVYCARICPTWTVAQYEDEVVDVLSKCLALLRAVRSAEDADTWLAKAKQAMKQRLEKESWLNSA